MSPTKTRFTILTGAVAAMLALATGGMAMGPPFEPERLSSLNIKGLAGYEVFDAAGEKVGTVTSVMNRKGRTLSIDVKLDAGGTAKVAAYRAFLDARNREIGLLLSEDLLIARAERESVDKTLHMIAAAEGSPA